MDAKTLRRARKVSSALFGAKHRLPVVAVIAEAGEEELYAAQIAKAARTTQTQAGAELRRLHAAGLLDVLAPVPSAGTRGRPPQLYVRRPSAMWELGPRLAEERLPPPRRG